MRTIKDIPRGDYCYTTVYHGNRKEPKSPREITGEDFLDFIENSTIHHCPYYRTTDYGMCFCDLLSISAVLIGEGCYEKALRHYGSEEELEKHDMSIILGDQVRVCEKYVDEIESKRPHSSIQHKT